MIREERFNNQFCEDVGTGGTNIYECSVASQIVDTISAGSYVLKAESSSITFPIPDGELGSTTNPIVFPTISAGAASHQPTSVSVTHGTGAEPLTVNWTRTSGAHSGFRIYYGNSMNFTPNLANSRRVSMSDAGCTSMTACAATVAYSELDGISGATDTVFVKVAALLNNVESALSEEKFSGPLRLSNSQSLSDTVQSLSPGATNVSIALGSADGGISGATKTYTLTRTTGAANLAVLGLQAVAGNPAAAITGNTSTTPITITNLPDGTRTGSITLRYQVDDSSDAATDSYTFTITVAPPTPSAEELADTALPHIIGAIQNTIADNIGERVRNVRNGENATGLRGIWGVGNSQTLDGESNGVKWDGSLSGFSLGADTVLASGNLFGVAFNRQSGEFDVTKNASSSKYDLSLSTFSPYFGGKFRGLDYHASLNLGSGEFGNLDLSSSGVALGGARLFRENRFGEQHFKGDFLYSSSKVGDASFSSGRLRAILEQQKQQNANLQLSGEIGGRLDFGNSSGFGVEAVGGLRHSKGKLAIDGQVRTLLFHSETVSEFGLQVRIQVTPGNDGQGLSLQLTPSYGESESNLENLWENGIGKVVVANPDNYALRINARLGFGLALPNAGLVTPYATARYGDTSQFGFGVNWKPKVRDLELDLLGEQLETQQRVLLKGSFGF